MGASAVPSAKILPPRATTRALASAPWPGLPLMTVPGSMVRVSPSSTNTRPLRTYSFSAVHRVLPVISASVT